MTIKLKALNSFWAATVGLGFLFSVSQAVCADIDPQAAARGLEVAKELVRRDTGWGDSKATMTMILTNKQGDESRREMRLNSLEVQGDGDKGLTIFDEPRDVKGTAFLSFTHATVADEQWLYLPALKRVKRISSSNKSGPFMGSEYAFEDLTSFEIEKYDYEFLREDEFDGQKVFVVRNFPLYKKSGYTKQEAWIDQEEYRVLKVDYFDRKNAPLKTLVNSDFKQYLDQYWRPHKASMVNHQNGKRTDLIWSDYEFQTGLNDGDFSRNSLQRAR